MKAPSDHLRTIQRRVDFLKSRTHKNSFDLAELGALEWALVNLQAQRKPLTDDEIVRMAGNHPWLHGKDRPAYIRGFYDAELFHNIKENT